MNPFVQINSVSQRIPGISNGIWSDMYIDSKLHPH